MPLLQQVSAFIRVLVDHKQFSSNALLFGCHNGSLRAISRFCDRLLVGSIMFPGRFEHKPLKMLDPLSMEEKGVLRRKSSSEKTFLKTIVVLIRNTTWRCGKLERSVVRLLHRCHAHFGKKGMSVNDIMENMQLESAKQNELLDAIKRLEKRNIVRLLPL